MNAAREASAAQPWAEKVDAHRAALVGHGEFIAGVDALLAEHAADRAQNVEEGSTPRGGR